MGRAANGFVTVGLFASLFGSGCLWQHMMPEERVREAVTRLNDDQRWHELVLATEQVSPGYRKRFLKRRRSWGRDIRIADTELMAIKVKDSKQEASSFVAFRWYDERHMTLHQTTLKQRWKHHRDAGGFVLVEEEVLDGPSIFSSDDEEEAGSESDRPEGVLAPRAAASLGG
jgi:hypothetical protein